MRIFHIIWLEDIEEKCISKHRVDPVEVEEVFRNKPKYGFVEKGIHKGENLYVALGQTDAGRYLAVYFIHKGEGIALVISARDMNARERKAYEKK